MAISKPRNRVVLFRLTQDEFAQVQQACAEEGARSVSDFARVRILGTPQNQGSALASLEAKIIELSRTVEQLAQVVQSGTAPRSEAASAGYGQVSYLAKSGD